MNTNPANNERRECAEGGIPQNIEVRGARVHNLKNVDVDVPLHHIVGIAGVSGSGKSSLALGVLYSEGSRRYLEALSTYTRRRMTFASEADVDSVEYVPAALALHQRPSVPGIRSTFGTMTELLNSLRLLFSRVASHKCPNGHFVPPSTNVAADKPLECPECGAEFFGPSAEDLAFNSGGACPACSGTGTVREVKQDALVPDPSKTLEEGAVAPWNQLMWSLMVDVAREMGVRTDVPFQDLTDEEKEIALRGPMVKKHILYRPKNGGSPAELDFTFYSAEAAVENALSKAKDEKALARVAKFLVEKPCPECHGTRLAEHARTSRIGEVTLPEATAMTLEESVEWVAALAGAGEGAGAGAGEGAGAGAGASARNKADGAGNRPSASIADAAACSAASIPAEMRPMAKAIADQYLATAARLMELGLGYLSLDRAGATLSTGERQRVQLARSVRNRTTGVLYVLDEPSIGLHPSNIAGLIDLMGDLVAHGNSVVLVDHDPQIMRAADWVIEMGPHAGKDGGEVIAQGSVADIEANPNSLIGPFLAATKAETLRQRASEGMFDLGAIRMETAPIHTVHSLEVDIPLGRMTAVTGVSGSGKTTMVLESLVPALSAACSDEPLPSHVRKMDATQVKAAKLVDATPIGANVRSTVATYTGVMDLLRKLFAGSEGARAAGLAVKDFSYNTGSLRCPECDGTGHISLDVQFLPDVEITCGACKGLRYGPDAARVRHTTATGASLTLPECMALTVSEALDAFGEAGSLGRKLKTLVDLGLGYLTLGEATPTLSGGEAQRLKLASELGKSQKGCVFVFDEPTIGLHPLDVKTLVSTFQALIDKGGTVVVIEHDLDLIENADYIIDMGPGGGESGGRIVAQGTPEEVAGNKASITGRFLRG